MLSYTHFRYIAYQCPTVGWDGNNAIYSIPQIAIPIADETDLQGDTGNLSADAEERIQRFLMVLNAAEEAVQAQGGDDNYTLKVFVAPEFYFRPSTAGSTTGELTYSYQEYQAIKDVLRATIYADNRYRHWLIICGTIIWEWTGNTVKRANAAGNTVYFNSCVYVKGGAWLGYSHVLEKYRASPIDGIPTGRHGGGHANDATRNATDEQWNANKYTSQAKCRKHISSTSGIRWGIEICLEHGVDVVNNNQFGNGLIKGTLNGWDDMDIHLQILTAGGMTIDPVSVATMDNGHILRNDGYGDAQQTNFCQVTGYTNGGLASTFRTLASTATLNPDPAGVGIGAADNALVDHTVNIGALHGAYIGRPNGCQQADWFAQCIKLYQRTRI